MRDSNIFFAGSQWPIDQGFPKPEMIHVENNIPELTFLVSLFAF